METTIEISINLGLYELYVKEKKTGAVWTLEAEPGFNYLDPDVIIIPGGAGEKAKLVIKET